MRDLLFPALVILGVLIAPQSSFAIPEPPPGAVGLPDESLRFVGGVVCGFVEGEWLPGSLLGSSYFVTHAASADYWRGRMASARGRRRIRAKSKARSFRRRAQAEGRICEARPWDGGGDGPDDGDFPDDDPGRGDEPGRRRIAEPLPFSADFDGALALVLGRDLTFEGDPVARTNLRKLTGEGRLVPVFDTHIEVARMLVGPSNSVFVVFGPRAHPGAPDCRLARFLSNGSGVCIETLSSLVVWNDYDGLGSPHDARNPAIQFDAEGSAYYRLSKNHEYAFRKFDDISVMDIHTERFEPVDFLILPDGAVAYTGSDLWAGGPGKITKLLRRNGELLELARGEANFLKLFPDLRIYLHLSPGRGIKAILPSPGLASEDFIGDDGGTFACDAIPIESACGFDVREVVSTQSGHVFALAGSGSTPFRLYPYPERVITTLRDRVDLVAQSGGDLYLAGRTDDYASSIVRYDSLTKEETVIYRKDEGVHFHRMAVGGPGRNVVFEFYDNGKMFIALIDEHRGVSVFPSGDRDSRAIAAFE